MGIDDVIDLVARHVREIDEWSVIDHFEGQTLRDPDMERDLWHWQEALDVLKAHVAECRGDD